MGLLNITRDTLRSQIVRQSVTKGTGTRTIQKAQPAQGNWFTNLFSSITGAFVSLGGFIISALGGIGFSFTALMGWLQSGIGFIYRFNWNISDRSIDQLLKNMRIALVGQMGEAAGNFIGFTVCGLVPAVVIAKFNKPLGAYVLKEVSEEAFDELMGNLRALIQQTGRTLAGHVFYLSYKNVRRVIKQSFKNPNSAQSRAARSIFGSNFNNWVKAWGEENTKPWSFASAVEEAIESLPDGYIEEFVENFYEGFLEGCSEGGFVLANSLDRYFAEQRLNNNQLLGDNTTLEVIPNRQAQSERVIVAGPEQLVRTQLVNIITQHQLIDNRDIGQFVGEIHRDSITKNYIEGIALKINFRGEQTPPFRDSKRVNYTVPRIKRSKLDWAEIKIACGGENGYLWGRYSANIVFKTPGVAPMRVYAASEGEAEDRAKALILLTDLEIASLTITQEKKEGNRLTYSNSLYKEATRVYPAFLTIINREKILNETEGRATISGAYKEKKYRVPLWPEEKPADWDDIVTEILTTRGANP